MKISFRISILLLLGLLLASCGGSPSELPNPEIDVVEATHTPQPTEDPTITLTDGLNRTITLPGPAQSVISLAPSNTEILFALDAGEQVVGRDAASNYPEEALTLADIGDTFIGLNTETIVSLAPDLILAAEITPVEYVAQLEQLGLTVYWLANPLDLDGLYTNLQIVGELVGREEKAVELIASLQTRASAVTDALADISDRPTVFYELDASDAAAPWTAGAGTFIDLLITTAGGQNVGGAIQGDYGQISIEQLLVQNPVVILLGDAVYGVTVESVAQRAGWGQLAAVQNNQVFPFDDNLVSRPGPRLIDALEQLAALLHPDRFN